MEKYTVYVYNDRTEWTNEAGKFHRLDGPAIEYTNGDKIWYQNGQRHRLDGPAAEYKNGDKWWYHNGKFHRLDGPAVEYANGYKAWYQNGKRHRLDGPAVEYQGGVNKEYWINGEPYTEQEFLARIKQANVLTPTEEDTLKSLAEKLGYKLEKLPAK